MVDVNWQLYCTVDANKQGEVQRCVSRGVTNRTKIDFLKVPKWILLWFQYIRPGEKEFLDLVHVLTLHISPEVLHFWPKIALKIATGRKWRSWSKWSKLEFYLLRWTIQPPDNPQTPPRHLPDTFQTPYRHTKECHFWPKIALKMTPLRHLRDTSFVIYSCRTGWIRR